LSQLPKTIQGPKELELEEDPSPLKPRPARKKQNQGLVSFFFKGFPEDVRFRNHTVPESLRLAEGTLYETWFNALKLSPHYINICETQIYPSDAARRTYELFGNIRSKNFGEWWIEVGYGLFAEQKPFNKIEISEGENSLGESTPVLKLEIPLNVSPKTLMKQFEALLEIHHPHYKDFDRWKASTASLPLQNRKLTSASLDICLDVLKESLKPQDQNGKNTLYDIGERLKLNPRAVIKNTDLHFEQVEKKAKMSATVGEHLEKARNLVAWATEGYFPCVEPHEWVPRKTRTRNQSEE
jgi:hypothetical protein